MTFRKFPYYCVLFIVTLSTLFLSCNNLLLEKKNADFSVQITMPPAYSTTAGSDPLTGGDISTEAPAEKWNLIAWVEEEGNPEHLSPQTISAMSGEIKKINFEKIDVNLKVRVCMTLESSEGKVIYKGESKWFVTQPGTNNISLELVKVPVDALAPEIKNQSKEVYITEDNPTVELFVEACSPDEGTLSFIWEKKISSDEWERVSIPQSVEENDVQDGDKQIRLFKSKITVSEKGTYQCIVLNTNIDATGNITAKKTSSLIEVHFVEGSLTSIYGEYIGEYELFGSDINRDNLEVYAIYSNNGEENRVPITDLDELEIVSEDTDSIGYVPYTVSFENRTYEVKIPVKYKLEANNIELESYFNNNPVSFSNEDKLSVPRYATLSCSYKLDNISLKLIDENGNENQIKTINEYYRATITNSSNISEGDYCETTGEYKVTLNSNNDWFVCEEDNNKEFYVEVCPWEIKFTEANGTNGNPVSDENLKIDTTYVLSVANDAWENHGLQVKFAGEGVSGGETTSNYFFVIPENGSSTITAKTGETVLAEVKIDVKAGNTEEISLGYEFSTGSQQEKGFDPNDVKFENNTVSVTHPETTTIDSVFNYYIRAEKDLTGNAIFSSGSNYKVYLEMQASEPTVVGIQAAYADMFFTVGTELDTYEFETGYIDVAPSNEGENSKNGITIGSALVSELYIKNISVELIREETTGEFVDDGLPTLSFYITPNGIKNYLNQENRPDQIIEVSKNDETNPTGYNITINTPISNNGNQEVTLQLRDYVEGDNSVNIASFNLTSKNDLKTGLVGFIGDEGYDTARGEYKDVGIDFWKNPVDLKEHNDVFIFPLNNGEKLCTIDGLLEGSTEQKTEITISGYEIKTCDLNEGIPSSYTFVINGNKIESLGNIELNKDDNGILLLVSNELETFNWNTLGFYCKFFNYTTNGKNININDTNDNLTIPSQGKYKYEITLTDDFTVQIEEVESDSGEISGGTENGESGDSIDMQDLGYFSKSDGKGGNIDTFYIYTQVGLEAYRNLMNGDSSVTLMVNPQNGQEFYERTFQPEANHRYDAVLEANIEVSDWVPIGTAEHPFISSFDGQGHSITINSMSSDAGDYAGLFGFVRGYSAPKTISNIVVKGTFGSTSTRYVGGIVAYAQGIKIENCVNMASLNSGNYVGGIIGFVGGEASSSTNEVSKCINAGTIRMTTVSSNYSGGIVAHTTQNMTISDCINLIDLASNGIGNICGIVDVENTSNKPTVSVNSCINVGNISVSAPLAIASTNAIIANCYYDVDKWEGNTPNDSSKISPKTTAELTTVSALDGFSTDNWSFDTNRYPLPYLSNVFTPTIWDEIVTAANTSGTN